LTKFFTFICDATDSSGLGHFSRCFNIARALQKFDNRIFIQFVGQYGNLAKQILAGAGLEYRDNFSNDGLKSSTVVLDSYDISQSNIDELISRSMNFVKIDDFNDFDLSKADMVVNFRFGAEEMLYNCPNSCLGIKFFPSHPELRIIRLKKLAALQGSADLSEIKTIMVFIGGQDQFSIASLLSSHLDQIVKNKRIIVTSKMGENSKTQAVKNNVLEHRAFTDNISDLYQIADVVISGGGLTKYEAAYCCIPNACVSQTEGQAEDTKILAAAHLTFDLGMASKNVEKPGALLTKLSQFFSQPELQRQRNGMMDMFDTESVSRLAEKLGQL
jgi:spore coat polysaccharide biosynthesis predicted glycosyltransferase SpsG